MGSKVEVKQAVFCGREVRAWSCCGPCMISFGIPLLIPGVTLTCVALTSNTGVEAFTGLHVTGFIFLAIGIFLICLGCVVYNVFRVKVGPLPIVLLSHADLRLTHSQRLYLNNKPTFEIRKNSVKPSTCFKVENETKPSGHRPSDKVSKLPEKFNRQNDDVSATNSKPSTSHTNPKVGSSDKHLETESSETSSSESDSEDYTSDTYSSTDTSSSRSEPSLPRPQAPLVKTTTNITVAAAANSATENTANPHTTDKQTSPETGSGKFTQLETSTHSNGFHNGSLTRPDYSYSGHFTHPSEDVKSEELKQSSVATRAWQISDSETDGSPPVAQAPRGPAVGKRAASGHVNSSDEDADVSASSSEDSLSTTAEMKLPTFTSQSGKRRTPLVTQLSSD